MTTYCNQNAEYAMENLETKHTEVVTSSLFMWIWCGIKPDKGPVATRARSIVLKAS